MNTSANTFTSDKYQLSVEQNRLIAKYIYNDMFTFLIQKTPNELYKDDIIKMRILELVNENHEKNISISIEYLIDNIFQYCNDNGITYDKITFDINYKKIKNMNPNIFKLHSHIDYIMETIIEDLKLKLIIPLIEYDSYNEIYNVIDNYETLYSEIFEYEYITLINTLFIKYVFTHFEWTYNIVETLDSNKDDDSESINTTIIHDSDDDSTEDNNTEDNNTEDNNTEDNKHENSETNNDICIIS